jgi:hypothetical protein
LLRQQLIVLQRQVNKPKFRPLDRCAGACFRGCGKKCASQNIHKFFVLMA